MNEMFDPNAGAVNAPNWQQQASALKRQRMIADYLRKQASEAQVPQGQMISGHYVAPSIFQHLNQAFQQYQAGRAEDSAGRGEDAFAKQADDAQRSWQSSLPRATAATTKPYMAPGMEGDENIPGTTTNVPAQLPSHGQVLEAAMRGAQIPNNAKSAELWATGMGKDLERADNQTFRRETREDTQSARRDEQVARDRAASALQAERLAEEAKRAFERSQDRRYGDDQRRESRREVAEIEARMRRAIHDSKAPKPISNAAHKELSALEDNVGNISGLVSSFKPEYSGPLAAAKNAASPYIPGMDTNGAEWWKNYAKSASLVERHALFGATLNANEKASWAAADINSAMDSKMIERNLATRERLAKKLFANGVSRYELDYPHIREMFNPEVPRETVNVESDKPGRPRPVAPASGKKVVKWGELG